MHKEVIYLLIFVAAIVIYASFGADQRYSHDSIQWETQFIGLCFPPNDSTESDHYYSANFKRFGEPQTPLGKTGGLLLPIQSANQWYTYRFSRISNWPIPFLTLILDCDYLKQSFKARYGSSWLFLLPLVYCKPTFYIIIVITSLFDYYFYI